MRRSEFASTKQDEDFNFITQRAIVGYLGLIDTNQYPRIVPLNFAPMDRDIIFHGAKAGEKYELMQKGGKASFSADIPYSFIPSYFTSKKSAEPTTHYFKSLHMRGKIRIIADPQEKAVALMAMMNKYQPEGKFIKIDANLDMYKKPLEEVGVFRFVADEISLKIKFRQNSSQKQIEQIIALLRERGTQMDLKTVEEIIKRSPYNLNHLLV